MNVQKARTDDVGRLLPLVAQYWEFEGLTGFRPAAVRGQLDRLLASSSIGTVWVATEAQQLLGYLILVYVFSLEHQGMTAEIDEFFVRRLSPMRRQGSVQFRAAREGAWHRLTWS